MPSTNITTELVKELRDSTGISVMQCKRALEEAEGDLKKALAILKKTSADIAQKKLNRDVKAGGVSVKMESGKAVLVSLHCETDFVAKNEDFIKLLDRLTDLALEKMSAQGGSASGWKSETQEMINSIIQKTGENIRLGDIYEVKGNILGNYVHNNNKIGAIVSLEGGSAELAKDIAMHAAAMQPEGIPELLGQSFIKNLNETIGQLLERAQAKIKEIKVCSI
jgi:elongation factor Ts